MMVHVPTLVLWGLKDTAFDNSACLQGLKPLVPDLTVKTQGYENVSHWIAQENPAEVSADILAFLKQQRRSPPRPGAAGVVMPPPTCNASNFSNDVIFINILEKPINYLFLGPKVSGTSGVPPSDSSSADREQIERY